MTPQKDLEAIKGNNFNLLLTYFDSNDAAISATFQNIDFKIFKSVPTSQNLVLQSDFAGVTYLITGLTGLSHDSGISFVRINKDENLATLNGGIYFEFTSNIMGYLPAGRHFYTVELNKGSTFSDMLLRGRFEILNEDGGLI